MKRYVRTWASAACLLTVLLNAGCRGLGTGATAITDPPPSQTHVFMVVEENRPYSQVIGAATIMPYLNSLATKYGLATQYYADFHPSIPNYFMLTTGQPESFLDNTFQGPVTDDNIVRELVNANKTWHCYAESLPSVGYTGGDVYPYVKHHNPFAYFSDVIGTSQANNIVPFTQFSTDLASGTFPDFSFIIPNQLDNSHNGSAGVADQWLQINIDPLIQSSGFQQDGLLIIVFDESLFTDLQHGGGHIAWVVIGPKVKNGYQSTTFYQHESTLRLILSTLGVSTFPGAASSAPDMGEFFQ